MGLWCKQEGLPQCLWLSSHSMLRLNSNRSIKFDIYLLAINWCMVSQSMCIYLNIIRNYRRHTIWIRIFPTYFLYPQREKCFIHENTGTQDAPNGSYIVPYTSRGMPAIVKGFWGLGNTHFQRTIPLYSSRLCYLSWSRSLLGKDKRYDRRLWTTVSQAMYTPTCLLTIEVRPRKGDEE